MGPNISDLTLQVREKNKDQNVPFDAYAPSHLLPVLRYPNFGEEIKQWTDVHGVGQTPATTDSPQSGWTRTRYGGTGAMAPVEANSFQGVGHALHRHA